MSGAPDLACAALDYAAQGLPVFPCNPANKRPLTPNGFRDASRDPATITRWWSQSPSAMIGIPTGEASGFWALDVDDPEAFEAAAPTLPATRKVKTGKGYHLHFANDPEVRNAQRHATRGWPFPELPGAEVRGEGGYVIVPPSVHPSGKAYTWANNEMLVSAPANLLEIVTRKRGNLAELGLEPQREAISTSGGIDTPYGLKALENECVAILLAGDGEQESTLNEAALKIGALVAGGELSAKTAKAKLIEAGLGMTSHDPRNPWTDAAVRKKVERGLADGVASPRSAPARDMQFAPCHAPAEIYDPETGEVLPPNTLVDSRVALIGDGIEIWPDPIPLRDELPPVQAFKSDLLPSQLRGWVMDIAERMNCPADLVGIPAMVSAGALIGRKIGIRPQRRTDWLEVGNLWGCVVAPPGSLKSPAAAEALGPIKRLEAKAAQENDAALKEHKANEALYKLEKEAAEKSARQALTGKGSANGRDVALSMLLGPVEPTIPPMKRYLTSDGTAEKLGEICKDNPDGIMVHRDELLSLFSELDRSEKASARGFYLSGWGGQDSYTFDRIMRGTIRIPAVNISLCGTTQPNRLAGYIRESLRSFDDGMVQRLQLLAWPDFNGKFREVDRYPDSDARQAAQDCLADLADMDVREIGAVWEETTGPYGVPFLRFADDAQEAFSEWWAKLEHRVRGDELSNSLKAHLSKYRGLIPRLALVCHLANNDFGPVSLRAALQAMGWADYLESHACRAYASLSADNAEAARAIWRRVCKGDLAPPFTGRDIQRKGWSGLADKDRVAAGLAALQEADWIGAQELQTGGRPTTVYWPNPKVLKA